MPEWLIYLTNFAYAVILAAVPLLYGTLGETLMEKSGNLNLGVEGMMYMGAIFGFWAAYTTGSYIMALVGAFVAGGVGALIYAFLTVTMKANQNVTGLTLTIFGTGIANFIGEHLMLTSPTGAAILSDNTKLLYDELFIPGLSEIPVIGKLLFNHSPFIYIAFGLAIVMGLYLNHTRVGLNLRGVGENPAAADAAGVNVSLYKYLNICVGGGICGLGGCYVSLYTCGGAWTHNCINGLGWISVALVIFASWSPYRAILGALVFGALSVLRLYIPAGWVTIPMGFFSMLPFVATAVVLVVSSIKMDKEKAQPKGCGVNYFREER